MAVNAYLVIDGRPGPSTSKADAIDILSFSFGASQAAVDRRGIIRRRSTCRPGECKRHHHHEGLGQSLPLCSLMTASPATT